MGLFKQFLLERKLGKYYDYASSQFNLPYGISEEIYEWGLKNIPDSEIGPDGRQAKDDIHITLKYGLKTDYFETLIPLVQCFNPFTVKLSQLDVFKKEDQDVLIIRIQPNDQLMIMNNFFKRNLDNIETFPNFTPHITIAYTKKDFADKFVGSSVFEGTEIYFEGVNFSSKQGEKTFIPFKIQTVSPPIGKFNVLFRS